MTTHKGIFLLLLLAVLACKPTKKLVQAEETLPIPMTADFPESWIGHYQGQLNIQSGPEQTSEVHMQVIIKAADATGHYPWILIYAEEDVRSYGLVTLNKDKGHYLIDEYNSIKIEGYLKGDHFVSRFNVMGSDLLVDYEKKADELIVRFYVSQVQPVSETGGEIFEADTVAIVNAFPIAVFQEAILKRIDE